MKLNLFASCLPIKGANRSTILDLNRNELTVIPNSLYEIIMQHKGTKITEVKKLYAEEDGIITEYINFLIDKEFINANYEEGLFPDIPSTIEFTTTINNMVIDIKEDIGILPLAIKSACKLEIQNVQIRIFYSIEYKILTQHLALFDESVIRGIELILPFSEEIYNKRWDIVRAIPRITNIIFYKAPSAAIEKSDILSYLTISTLTQQIFDESGCGNIFSELFSYSLLHYTEAQHHNTCLNRKIAIDSAGNIKNCPSMKESYGNIRDTTLLEAIEKPGFKKYWNITKDQTAVCKDCEFRYVCTDCRAYIEDPEDIYSKPLKCGYNPYTCEWEEWSTHPMKQAAIQFYGMEELVAERQIRLAGKAASEQNETEK